MRFLCGRLAGFKREGVLHNTVQESDVNLMRNYHVPTDRDPERSREELDQKIEVRHIQTLMQFVAVVHFFSSIDYFLSARVYMFCICSPKW